MQGCQAGVLPHPPGHLPPPIPAGCGTGWPPGTRLFAGAEVWQGSGRGLGFAPLPFGCREQELHPRKCEPVDCHVPSERPGSLLHSQTYEVGTPSLGPWIHLSLQSLPRSTDKYSQ